MFHYSRSERIQRMHVNRPRKLRENMCRWNFPEPSPPSTHTHIQEKKFTLASLRNPTTVIDMANLRRIQRTIAREACCGSTKNLYRCGVLTKEHIHHPQIREPSLVFGIVESKNVSVTISFDPLFVAK